MDAFFLTVAIASYTIVFFYYNVNIWSLFLYHFVGFVLWVYSNWSKKQYLYPHDIKCVNILNISAWRLSGRSRVSQRSFTQNQSTFSSFKHTRPCKPFYYLLCLFLIGESHTIPINQTKYWPNVNICEIVQTDVNLPQNMLSDMSISTLINQWDWTSGIRGITSIQ